MKKINLPLSVFVEFIPNCGKETLSTFKFLAKTNRKPKEAHVNELAESFKLFGTASATITVLKTKAINGKVEYYIVDGQHRYLAAQRLNANIHVIIVELTDDTKLNITRYIATLNNTSSGWSPGVYLESYLDNDLREYMIINELKSSTGLTMTDLMFIFLGSNNKKIFASGEMKFLNEADSMELLEAVMSVKNVIPNKAFVRRSLYKIMRLCKDYKRMAKAILITAEALKTAHTKFSENESEFFAHLVKIYKAEFKVK